MKSGESIDSKTVFIGSS